MTASVRLHREQLVELAELVADVLEERQAVRSTALVGPLELARVLGVSRGFVYEHADELGARRLGSGSRPRLRFDVDEAARRLTACQGGRESAASDAASEAVSPRRRRRRSGTSVDLLPVNGLVRR